MGQSDFCHEHSGQKTLLYALLGLVGVAVSLLIFQVGLTITMGRSLSTELSMARTEWARETSAIKERLAVLEYRIVENR